MTDQEKLLAIVDAAEPILPICKPYSEFLAARRLAEAVPDMIEACEQLVVASTYDDPLGGDTACLDRAIELAGRALSKLHTPNPEPPA